MKTILYKTEKNDISKADFQALIDHLRLGNIAILPTDTIYGFSCVATIPQAITKITKIKNRPKDKPYIILISSIAMARRYASLDARDIEVLKSVWASDEPTSIIVKAKDMLPAALLNDKGEISLRLPKSELLIRIIRSLGLPIVSSSLNISGKSYINDLSKLEKIYGDKLDDVMLLDKGPAKRTEPSQLFHLDNGELKQIR